MYCDTAGPLSGPQVAISSDGSTFALSCSVGASGYPYGRVSVYKYVSGVFSERHDAIYGTATTPGFGTSLALNDDGTILAVGITGTNTEGTIVRTYSDNDDAWVDNGGSALFSTINLSTPLTTYNNAYGPQVQLSADGMLYIIMYILRFIISLI